MNEKPPFAIYLEGRRYIQARDYQRLVGALVQIISRSHSGDASPSTAADMRRIAEEALEGGK